MSHKDFPAAATARDGGRIVIPVLLWPRDVREN